MKLIEGLDRHGERCHVGAMVVVQAIGQEVQGFGVEERFVALKVDDGVGVDLLGHLGNPVGAGGMVAARQDSPATEAVDGGGDARVVRGNEDEVGTAGLGGAFVNVLDEVLARLPQQRFAGQPGGSVTGRDDNGGFHGDLLVGWTARGGWYG